MKYGFIGCGNMGGAIAKALSRATKEIMVSDRSGKAKAFAEELGIVYSDAETIAARCDRIFIAVKPHMVQEVLSPLHTLEQRVFDIMGAERMKQMTDAITLFNLVFEKEMETQANEHRTK